MPQNQPLIGLRPILLADALACLGLGAGLACLTPVLASLTELPSPFLREAGLILLPIVAFILWLATRRDVPAAGVMLVVVGNALWVTASVSVLVAGLVTPNGPGVALILGQAAAVGLIAALEHACRPRRDGAAMPG